MPISGVSPANAAPEFLRDTYVENLKFAADRLGSAGIRLLVEPINPLDVPGFFLDSVELAAEMLDRVDRENVFIQYDLYHRARTGGADLLATYLDHREQISHVQIADCPGRHEPGTGDIDFPAVFSGLDEAGYDGWIGCEYFPQSDTLDGLGWIEAYR